MLRKRGLRVLAAGGIICAMLASNTYAGTGSFLLPVSETALAAGTEQSKAGDPVDTSVVKDEKLLHVLQILANYQQEENKDFYKEIVNDSETDVNEADSVDITTLPEAADYDKEMSVSVLEAYTGEINLAPYDGLKTLEGINSAKCASRVVLPKKLDGQAMKTIGGKIFYEMTDLTSVVMPETVEVIGDSAFEKCESLRSIYTYKDQPSEVSERTDDVLDLRRVKEIGISAFSLCLDIRNVNFYEYSEAEEQAKAKIFTLKSNAFNTCRNLKAAVIPRGTMGTGVFASCLNLQQATFDDTYTKIQDNTFTNVTKAGLKVDLPASLEEIGAYAFEGSAVTECDLSACTNLKKIGEYAFRNTANGWECDLSACTGLDTICRDAFANAVFSSYHTVKLPDGLKNLGSAVFFATSGIETVNIPKSLEKLPEGTFLYCYDLNQVIVPEDSGVTEIGAHAFDLCGNLENINFLANMKKLTGIGDYAFARCISGGADQKNGVLHGLRSVVIPDTVTELGEGVFENDFLVETVNPGVGITKIPNRFLICEDKSSVTWKDVTLEDPVSGGKSTYSFASSNEPGYKAIRSYFSGYSGSLRNLSALKAVRFSTNVTEIGDYAFFGNSSLAGISADENFGNAETLTFTDSLKNIGSYAFAKCFRRSGSEKNGNLEVHGIKNVVLPDGLKELGSYAFSDDAALETVVLPIGGEDQFNEIPAHCFEGCGFDDKYDDVSHYHGLSAVSDLKNYKVIGEYAFHNCYNLSSTVKADGSIAQDRIEFGSNLETLGRYAYAGTDIHRASSLSGTKITKIEANTFDNCRDLEIMNAPDTLEAIDGNAFKDCPSLSTLSFPVYATLSASMLTNDTQSGLTLTPTLGRFRTAIYQVPVGSAISLPANAFARYSSEKISQVTEDGTDTELSKADPKYFEVAHSGNEYRITGGETAKEGLSVRISATVPFTSSLTRTMSIDYPVNVIHVHADPDTIGFDDSKFKLAGGKAGILADSGDGEVLYIDSRKAGKILSLTAAAEAAGVDEYNKGMITDEAVWSVKSGSALTRKTDSEVKKTTSAKLCTTSAEFIVGEKGSAQVEVLFDDGTSTPPSKILKTEVIDPITGFDFTLESVGAAAKNPGVLTMPVDTADQIVASPVYLNQEDQRDYIYYTTDDATTVEVDANGKLTAKKAGKTKVNIYTASGTASRSITITVKEKEAAIEPVAVEIGGPKTAEGKGYVYTNETAEFTAQCLPGYADDEVTWSIGNSTDASLEADGNKATLTGLKANGSLTLTATAVQGKAVQKLNVVVLDKAASLEFKEPAPVIAVGSTASFRLSGNESQNGGIVRLPETSQQDVEFTSSDASVVALGKSSGACSNQTVTLSGKTGTLYYAGLKEGTATITAKTENGVSAELKVTVVAEPVTGITCEKRSVTLAKGAKAKMKITVTPAGSKEKLTYESSEPTVAKVDENGVIQAVAPGSARITVRSSVRKVSAYCDVNVPGKSISVKFVQSPLYIAAGEPGSLYLSNNAGQTYGVIRLPEDNWQDVTFTSSNTGVLRLGTSRDACTEASVTLSGRTGTLYFNGLKNGTAVITAVAENGAKASLKATVVAKPITALTCKNSSVTMLKGASLKMKTSKTPGSSTETVIYESSNESVVKVDQKGKIKAVGAGTARVTVRSRIRGVSAACNVTVLAKGQTVVVKNMTYQANAGKTLTLASVPGDKKSLTVPATVKISGVSYKVTGIGASACAGRTALKTVKIGANVTAIGKNAFSGCTMLKKVVISSKKLKKISKGAFKTIKKGARIKCPKSKRKVYRKLLKKSGLPKKAKVS